MKLNDSQVQTVLNALRIAAEQCRHDAAMLNPHARETEGEVETLRRLLRRDAEAYAALAAAIEDADEVQS